jgi:hypothetical protein
LGWIHSQLSWCYTATFPAFLSPDVEPVVHIWTATQQNATCPTNTIRFLVITQQSDIFSSFNMHNSNIQNFG